MKHITSLFIIIMLIVLTTFLKASETQKAQILEDYGKIPLSFTANTGQLDSQVKFTTSGNGAAMFFTQDGTTFLLSRETEESIAKRKSVLEKRNAGNKEDEPFNHPDEIDSEIEMEYFALKKYFVNANQNPDVIGEERLLWNNNYFIGNDPSEWQTDVPNYAKIRLRNIYDGIDLVYYGNRNKIKYDLIVQPGADPREIVLSYDFGNTSQVEISTLINQDGELVVKTPFGDLVENKPYCYQIINGQEIEVDISYTIINENSNTFTFTMSEYDLVYPVIIDPELSYSTYFGTSSWDYVNSISVDSDGNAYITGSTGSSDFPTTSGAYDQSYDENGDIFVTKLNPSGSGYVYSTYIGGNGSDVANGISIDGSGNAYIIGRTNSTDFPAQYAVYDNYSLNTDAFVTKLNSTGSGLVYSTYIGGSDYDIANGISIDGSGNAYIIGRTSSTDFPTKSAIYGTHKGDYDVFVTKFNSTGGSVYSTFIGGSDYENASGVSIDGSGNVYIIGSTNSSDFPTTSGSYDQSYNGGYRDVFVAKLNSTGSELEYSTFIGTSKDDEGRGISVDNNGNAYITGHTDSYSFLTTEGVFDEGQNGNTDAFVCKLNSSGNNLVYSTYLGGGSYDYGTAISVDGSGNAYITGWTESTTFPTTSDAYDDSYNGGGGDVYLTKLNSTASELLYSTYFGGDKWDYGTAIKIDESGNLYIVGNTESSDFPTKSALYGSFIGYTDAFVSKFSFEEISNTAPTASFTVTPTSGTTSTIFHLDASGSSDTEDAVSELQVRWDYYNDGIWDRDWSTTKTFNAMFNSAGMFTIKLEVKDSGGLTDTYTRTIQVSEEANTAPTASFTVTPTSGYTTTNFSFDASNSSDAQDAVSALQVRWDWENNGTWDTDWSTTKTASHQYTYTGTFTVKLEVKDSGGLTDTYTRTVQVSEYDYDPIASFTVTPTSGATTTYFDFNASGSSNKTGSDDLLQYRWDWENDGTWDTDWISTESRTHRFTETGTYTVKLEVKDTGGRESSTTRTVEVSANTAPTANFAVIPGSGGDISTNFKFDASASYDAEQAISSLKFRWDYENDGTWDDEWSFPTTYHQYSSPGIYTVKLEVSDYGPLYDTTTVTISVSALTSLDVGGITVYADAITSTEENICQAIGNVNINNIINFSGDVTIDKSALRISGSGILTITEVPYVDSVRLYEGQFDLDIAEATLEILKHYQVNELTVAGFHVSLYRMELITDGISVSGKLDLPKELGGGVQIDNLNITKNDGITVEGSIKIPDITVKGMELKDMLLTFDTAENSFGGTATLDMPILKVGGGLEFLKGELNKVSISIESGGTGYAIGTTGFFLTGGGGSVEHMSEHDKEKIAVELTVDITGGPTIADMSLVKFDDAGVFIQPQDIFKAKSDFELLTIPVSSGEIGYVKESFQLNGQIELIQSMPIVAGNLNIRITSTSASGKISGKITIPDFETSGYTDWAIKKLITTTVTLPFDAGYGETNILYQNNPDLLRFEGMVPIKLSSTKSLGIALRVELDPDFNAYVGTNYNNMVPVLKFAGLGKVALQDINIPFNTPHVIFVLEGDQSAVDFNLIKPDGSKILASEGETNQALFLRNDTEKTSFFVVENPEYGIWSIEVPDDGGNSLILNAIGANNPPTIDIQTPSQQGTSLGTIEWIDSDPDDSASVDLFYDTDNSGNDGVLITEGLSENDETDSYTWNISDVPSGEYYVYARIYDGNNPPSFSYSNGTILVTRDEAPAKPTGFHVSSQTDTSITFQWNANTETDLQGYKLYYNSQYGSEVLDDGVAVNDTNSFTIEFIKPGRSYIFALTAWDTTGFESLKSDYVTVTFQSATVNNAPYFGSLPSSNATVGELYQVTLDVIDADEDLLNLTLDGPTGMVLNSSAKSLEWTPDCSGVYSAKVIVSDGKGGIDSLMYNIHVITASQISATITSNAVNFVSTDENATIIIKDPDMNADEKAKDILNINISSESDPTGFSFNLIETENNTGIFKGTFGFTTENSDPVNGVLKVADGDSVYVLYSESNPETSHRLYMIWFDNKPLIPGTELIAHSSNRDGNWEIYLMNPDGTDQINITNNSEYDGNPSWSPDGSKIAFDSNRDGDYEIYVMNSNGTNVIQLTNNTKFDERPSWSPDGTKITFNSTREGSYEIYVMNSDGTNVKNLTNNAVWDCGPCSWSPDGSKIAFFSQRYGSMDIFVMNADGSNQKRLTTSSEDDQSPSWSPDGSKIVFHSERDGNWEIYVMNSDGSNQINLTNNSSIDWSPSWSPDGSKITFISLRDGNLEIYTMNSDGTNLKRLTYNSFEDRSPVWGKILTTSIKEIQKPVDNIPEKFYLFQNYPNPFNPVTTIKFQIIKSSFVTLKIYNILGQEVKTLVSRQVEPGNYSVTWDGRNNFGQKVSSGIYIYMIKADAGYMEARKMLFIK